MNSGAINSTQAQQLQNRANAIQTQEMRDMSQNGGTLTPQEQAQINRESARLNRAAHQDVRTDNPNANFNPNWSQQPGYNNQYNQNGQQWNQNNPNAQNYRRNRWNNNFFNR